MKLSFIMLDMESLKKVGCISLRGAARTGFQCEAVFKEINRKFQEFKNLVKHRDGLAEISDS
jgi:hypothetical protein